MKPKTKTKNYKMDSDREDDNDDTVIHAGYKPSNSASIQAINSLPKNMHRPRETSPVSFRSEVRSHNFPGFSHKPNATIKEGQYTEAEEKIILNALKHKYGKRYINTIQSGRIKWREENKKYIIKLVIALLKVLNSINSDDESTTSINSGESASVRSECNLRSYFLEQLRDTLADDEDIFLPRENANNTYILNPPQNMNKSTTSQLVTCNQDEAPNTKKSIGKKKQVASLQKLFHMKIQNRTRNKYRLGLIRKKITNRKVDLSRETDTENEADTAPNESEFQRHLLCRDAKTLNKKGSTPVRPKKKIRKSTPVDRFFFNLYGTNA